MLGFISQDSQDEIKDQGGPDMDYIRLTSGAQATFNRLLEKHTFEGASRRWKLSKDSLSNLRYGIWVLPRNHMVQRLRQVFEAEDVGPDFGVESRPRLPRTIKRRTLGVPKNSPHRILMPRAWLEVDHSNPRITPDVDIDEECVATLERIMDKAKVLLGGTLRVSEYACVASTGASANFRVISDSPKQFLLRVHQRLDTRPALRAVLALQSAVAGSDVFRPRDRDFLRPWESEGKQYVAWPTNPSDEKFINTYLGGDNRREFFVTVQEYHRDVHRGVLHYDGRNDQSFVVLKSVAQSYGALHSFVQNLLLNHKELEALAITREDLRCTDDSELIRLFNNVNDKILTVNTSGSPDPLIVNLALAWREEEVPKRCFFRVLSDFALLSSDRSTLVLADLHPQNIFADSERCRLIFDYEGFTRRWTHSGAVAFALHRLIREVVRRDGDKTRCERIREGVDAFIEGYEERGPKLDAEFRKQIAREIRYINLRKLLVDADHLAMSEWKGERDYKYQDRETLLKEVIKFISLISEADDFELS